MATGRRAFEGKSKASLIASILTSEPQPLSAFQPMTPATFDRVVRTCLQKDPDERWQSAHDVGQELRWIAEAPATTIAHPPASRWVSSALIAALLTTTALFAYFWRRAESARPPRMEVSILPPE